MYLEALGSHVSHHGAQTDTGSSPVQKNEASQRGADVKADRPAWLPHNA